jgi:cyanate permease
MALIDYQPPGSHPRRTSAGEFWTIYCIAAAAGAWLADEMATPRARVAAGRYTLLSVAVVTLVAAVAYWAQVRRLRPAYGLTVAAVIGLGVFLPKYWIRDLLS